MSLRGDAIKVMVLACPMLFLVFCPAYTWAQRGGAREAPLVPATPTPTLTDTGGPPILAEADTRPVRFSSRTELVLVPVVVTDKSRAHVSGLRKEDFRMFEDGKEQVISVFEAVRPEEARVRRPLKSANEFSNVLAGAQSPKRLTIIALDTVNTPFLDQTRAREQLIQYLVQTVEPGSLVSLITIHRGGIRVIHDFTSDTESLIAALRKVAGQLHLMEGLETPAPGPGDARNLQAIVRAAVVDENSVADVQPLLDFARGVDGQIAGYEQASAAAITLEAFQHIAQAYAGVPGRKSLIWATGSFPFRIDSDTAGMGGGSSALYERTMQMLTNANIAVYPIDARGLVVSVGPAHASTLSTLETFAAMTGGRAFYNRNDLGASFREATQDSSEYYMLGYYLDTKNTKPGWRKLSVKVQRDGVKVRSRNGFFVTRTTVEPETTRLMDVYVALRSPLDYTSLPLTLRWTGTEVKGGKRRVRFEIELPANTTTIDASDKNHMSLEFTAEARDPKGDRKPLFSQTIQARLRPEALEQVRSSGITYNNFMEVEPGEYTVRFVVRDNLSGRMGSVAAPLKVM